MSDYGYNFGFLRSDESSRSAAEGRFRTPATTGTGLQMGTMVEIDPANPGYLKQSAAGQVFITGFSGLLLQELDWLRSIYQSPANLVDTFMKGVAKPNYLAVITSGAGTKVWFKNTVAQVRADGRSIAAVNIINTAGLAVGSGVGWTGSAWGVAGTAGAVECMKVTNITAAGLVECVLEK